MKVVHYVVAGLVSVSSVLHAQSAPPVKMGLWQTTAITSMTMPNMPQLPPEVVERMKAMGRPIPGTAPTTSVVQSCLTPEKWRENWARSQQQSQKCETKNYTQDASGMSVDIECKTERGSSTGHTQMSFVNSETAHGTSHMEIISERSLKPITMNMTIDSVYQGADCKGISPDTPKVVAH
jgi:hypothetical protein